MECALRTGKVLEVTNHGGRQELKVDVAGHIQQAINYPDLTGSCTVGDTVTINTTAVELQLGTGGWHYVLAIHGREQELSGLGHIMKLRYTALQGRVFSVEEPANPHHKIIQQNENISGFPVAVGSLHSMLAPFAVGFSLQAPDSKLVYLMSDGAALPLAFSKTVEALQSKGLVAETITFGHAFGGDLEAVNVYSGLIAAKHVCHADGAIVLMGPGVVGTDTKWGTTAVEQGVFLNAVQHLQGKPIAILRMSEADERDRHFGISHHTMTTLQDMIHHPCIVPVPRIASRHQKIVHQLDTLQHDLAWVDTERFFANLLQYEGIALSSMGRTPADDPLFFHSAFAAGLRMGQLVNRGDN